MKEFDWIYDTCTSVDNPKQGTAWTILNIDVEDSHDIQRYLFSLGFRWSDGDTIVDSGVEGRRIRSLQCVFPDCVDEMMFTYSSSSNVDDDIYYTNLHLPLFKELSVYEWDGSKTVLKEIVKIGQQH